MNHKKERQIPNKKLANQKKNTLNMHSKRVYKNIHTYITYVHVSYT